MRILGIAILALLPGTQDEGPIRYADLSSQMGLEKADGLFREGKYWEAAVEYRNALLRPGDREAVRIPFALALLAHGDADYAGLELRRAQAFFDGFERMRMELDARYWERVRTIAPETPNGWAACAYVRMSAGESDAARQALGYCGSDDFSRALERMIGNPTAVQEPEKPKQDGLADLEDKAQKLPKAPPPIPKPGTPEVAGPSSFRKTMVLKEEVFEP